MKTSSNHSTNPLIERYLKRENSFKIKWLDYFERRDLQMKEDFYFPELSLFFGSEKFNQLTDEEKKASFRQFVFFFAELQIYLEKLVVYGFYKFRKHEHIIGDDIKRTMRLLAREELYHTQGYTHFLRQQNEPDHLLLDNKLLRFLGAFALKLNPLVITMVAAKFESFSQPYLQQLQKSIHDSQNGWYQINKIHMEDEIFHVPLQFDIYNASVKNFGYLRTLIPMLLLYLAFQFVLLIGASKMVNKTFIERNFFKRNFIIYPTLLVWCSRQNETIQKARKIMKHYCKKKNPFYQKTLKFLYR